MSRLTALLALLLLLPATAAAAPSKKLSDRLQRVEANRSAGLPASGPWSLSRRGDDYVTEIRTGATGTAGVDRLRAAGAKILHVSDRYDTVTAAIGADELDAVAGVAGVTAVDEVMLPEAGAVGERASTCPTGTATSEGVTQLKAALARTTYGIDGAGVTVGVLSDSYDTKKGTASPPSKTAADDIASGDLPGATNTCGFTTPVDVLQDYTPDPGDGTGDEGRAMLQIVHDVAPGARLKFATAFLSETSFADNIIKLKDAGAKVIVDDVIYSSEPFYQDGILANAVRQVTDAGVSYFSMAFNNGQVVGGNDVGSWEAPAYRPTTCPAGIPAGYADCMDFNPAAAADSGYAIGVTSGQTLRLVAQWAEPIGGVATNLDLFLLNGSTVSGSGVNANTGPTGRPIETASLTAGSTGTRDVVIARKSGSTGTPRVKFVINNNGGQVTSVEYPTGGGGDIVGPTIFGHNGTASAQTVGAIAYNATTAPELFSGRGPVTHYFAPFPSTAALAAPEVLSKPDVTATDKGLTTFFGSSNRFSGTSAAAPHAAAVAALQLQEDPALTPDQVKANQRASAIAIGSSTPFQVGAGLVQAPGAIAADTLAVTATGPAALGTDKQPATTFSANHRSATFSCAVDGGAAAACTSPFTPPAPLGDGGHSVTVTATDAGGATASSGPQAFTVDTTGPNAIISTGPAGLTNLRQPAFAFTGGELGATTKCAVDGGQFAPCTSPLTPTVPLADGKHLFAVEGSDGLGNTGTPALREFTVDATKPKVSFKKRPKKTLKSRKRKVKVTFTFKTEAGAKLTCKLDKGAFKKCSSKKKVTVKRGKHTLSVRATDAAGNVSKAATYRFRVKKKR